MDPWLLAIIVAFLPAVAWLAFFYLRDRYEREPIRSVLVFFGLGAVLALPLGIVLIPLVVVPLVDAIGVVTGDVIGLFVVFLLVAGLPEEAIKAGVARWRAGSEPDLDEPSDAMVYFTSVGLGFGALETVLFVANSYLGILPTGDVALAEATFFQVAVLRALTATVAHGLWSGIVGYYFARSRFQGAGSWFLPGVAVAGIVHAIYNTASSVNLLLAAGILLVTGVAYFALLRRLLAVSPHRAGRVAIAVKGD